MRNRFPRNCRIQLGSLENVVLLTGDRKFESISLQQRVTCEPVIGRLSHRKKGPNTNERGDFFAAIEVLAPLVAENERIGGSRAQHDLIEFTLLKAYLEADRAEEAQRLLDARRPGASGVPVTGVAAVH